MVPPADILFSCGTLKAKFLIVQVFGFFHVNFCLAYKISEMLAITHERSSIILTSNKGPEDWGELLGDQGITTAILEQSVFKQMIL